MTIRILYVDDEEYLLELGKEFLEEFGGIAVDTALSVQDALDMLSSEPYDGVISDYQMPLRDGLDLLAEVRMKYGAMPFVLFTGRGREAVVIKALELGANFYIQKGGDPVSQFTELFHKIKSAVEKHQMQLRIAENETLMGEAEKLAEMGSWSYDFVTKSIALSPQMHLILGLPLGGELSLKDLINILGQDASENLKAAVRSAREFRSPGFAHEFTLNDKDGKARYYKANILMTYDPNGEAVALTGVGQDISWLLASRENLEENARLNTLLDTIDDIVIVTDRTGNVLRANRMGINVFGMGEQWLIEQNFDSLISGIDGSPMSIMGTEIDPYLGNEARLRFLTHDGVGISADVRRSSGKWDGQDVLIFVARDISANLRTEKALKESEENFRTFFESMSDLIFVGTPEGQMMYCNDAVANKLGYDAEELLKMQVLDVHPKDKRSEAEAIFAAMFRGERESCPLPLASKDGTLLPVETRAWFGRWDGKDCIYGISKDLTAEQEAQQRFERLFRNNPASMALTVLPGRTFFDVNDTFLRVFGYDRNEIIGKTSKELGLFVRPELQEDIGTDLLAAEHFADRELQVRCSNGEIVDGLFSGELISNQGQQYLLTVMTDITARKRAEEELMLLSDRLSLATRAGGVGVWDMDVVNNHLNWDDQMFNLYGIRRGDFSGAYEAWGACLFPEDLQRGEKEIEMALHGEKEFDTEFRVLWPDGSVRNIRALARVQRDAQGNPLRMVGTNWDITEQKSSELYNRQLLSSISSGVVIIDPQTRVIESVNDAAAAMFGAPSEKILGHRCHSFLCPSQEGGCPICDLGKAVDNSERVLLCADGSRRPILKSVTWIEVHGRKKLLECFVDISERKKVEEEVQHQSAMLNSLLDSIPDIIFFKDLDGVYLGCNPAFAAFVGRTQKEIIGKTDYDLFSAEIADSFRDYDWSMLQERRSRRNNEWITYPNGKRKLIETLKTPYWGPDGKLVGILGISRDITEQAKKAENAD